MENTSLNVARTYHRALPDRIRRYLNERGIPDYLIDAHQLGWNGSRISIPILNREGDVVSFKLAKDPEDASDSPKMLATPGARAELYGWAEVLSRPQRIVICEGEFDRLVLEAQGFQAVTSTGGAGVFRKEWAREFEPIPEVYVCFDRDEAGQKGALRVGSMIPHAKIVTLPDEVGEAGDVTDFFIRLGASAGDFAKLLEGATPMPPAPEAAVERRSRTLDSALREKVDRLKASVSIAEVIGRTIPLRTSGTVLIGLCPFHDDHEPSFAVYAQTGRYYCFGCGKRGDVITFIRDSQHLSFAEALERLEQLAPSHDIERPEAA
jgi:DNA primase